MPAVSKSEFQGNPLSILGHKGYWVFEFQSCRRISLQRLEINNKRVLYSKYRVVIKILVNAVKYLRRHRLIAFALNLFLLDVYHDRLK
jgi:hypothetical protein